MIRETYGKKLANFDPHFRYRGIDPGRLENFSDAVFALAITLLLISTTPPSNFVQIKRFVYDLVPFILCITLIMLIWSEHFHFFLRYGLRNSTMVVLNALFLVLVLFFVYPLKFLTKFILIPIGKLVNDPLIYQDLKGAIQPGEMPGLMVIYGAGFACIFALFTFMYLLALKNAKVLDLNEIEVFDTKVSIVQNSLMGFIPLVSVSVAIIFSDRPLAGAAAGFVYMSYPIIMPVFGVIASRKRRLLIERHGAEERPEPGGELKNEIHVEESQPVPE